MKICVICNKDMSLLPLSQQVGNNPQPIKDNGICCDECYKLVKQARVKNAIYLPRVKKRPKWYEEFL